MVFNWRKSLACVTTTTVLLTSALGLAGCGQAQQANSSTTKGETITLLASKHPWTTSIQPYLQDFEKQTGIKVNVQMLTEQQTRDKALMTFQAKSPDVDVFMSLKSLEGLAYEKAGYYEPLDNYVKDEKQTPKTYKFEDFMKGPIDGERVEGKLVGIPIIVEGPVVYYRKDLFNQYNIPVPQKLDDLVTAAKTIKEKSNGEVIGAAIRGLPPSVAYTFGPFIHNMGIEWLDKNGQPNFDKPEAVKAIELYSTLAGQYGPPGVVNNSFYQSSSLFAQGKVAMEIESSNELSTITDPSGSRVIDKLGVIPIPPGPGGNHPTILQWGISISAFSQHKDAAWKFVQWATSPEMQLKLAQKGIASPRQSSWDNQEFKNSLKETYQKEWAAALENVMQNGNPEVGPPAVQEAEARKVLGDAIDTVILGQVTPEKASQNIQQQLVEVLKKQ